MFKPSKIFVRDRNGQYEETLMNIDRASLTLNIQKNQTNEITLTALDDGSIAYSLLQAENSLVFQGQEYVIKQAKTNFNGDTAQIDITATHVMYECRNVYVYKTNAGNHNYSVADIMHFYFDNNNCGFTWETRGQFPSVELQDLGNGSGKDAIDKCVSEFDAVVVGDNRHLIIESASEYVHQTDRVIRYLHDSSTMSVSVDSTSLQNVAMCYGKQNSSGDQSSYVFKPFLASDDTSITRWGKHPGADITDDRFTSADSMNKYALTKMQTQPLSVVELTLMEAADVQLGDVWLLINKQANFETDVTVDGIKSYPMIEGKPVEITLNNSYKTLYDFDSALQRSTEQAINAVEKIQKTVSGGGTGQNINIWEVGTYGG